MSNYGWKAQVNVGFGLLLFLLLSTEVFVKIPCFSKGPFSRTNSLRNTTATAKVEPVIKLASHRLGLQ